jgi:uncharacterized protein (TIGR03435 family)
MKVRNRAAIILACGALSGLLIHAQSSQPPTAPCPFEVASIKINQTDSDSRSFTTSPGGLFTAKNIPIRLLISRAYGVAGSQISGGPGWIDSEKYDIDARAATTSEMRADEVRPCLQALLTERLKFKFHPETRQESVLSLVVAKGGPKFKEVSEAGSPSISGSSGGGKASIVGKNVTIDRLAEYLSARAGHPVFNNTGLTARYNFSVEWAMDETADSGPSIFTALEDQLGLKLSPTKGPVEVIAIDSAEHATQN